MVQCSRHRFLEGVCLERCIVGVQCNYSNIPGNTRQPMLFIIRGKKIMNPSDPCFSEKIFHHITRFLIGQNITISTMESCTSGHIASLLTDTEGASSVFRGSFVTYSNDAKIQCGVPEDVIRIHGVYSRETAQKMAQTCRERFGTDIGIGVTGTFGNADPANADSIPGIVYAAISDKNHTRTQKFELSFHETRPEYKEAAASEIGQWLWEYLQENTEAKV